MRSQFVVATILLSVIGCREGGREGKYELASPERGSPFGHPLHRFNFTGNYAILAADRYSDAAAFAKRQETSDLSTYRDGLISLHAKPVPYGVQIELVNPRDETIAIEGGKCGLIDVGGKQHPIDLRDPESRGQPAGAFVTQTATIAPHSTLTVDLDVATPAWRHLGSPPGGWESGVMFDSVLPAFSTTYWMRRDQESVYDEFSKWFRDKQFGLHIMFAGDRSRYDYIFHIKPMSWEFSFDAGQ